MSNDNKDKIIQSLTNAENIITEEIIPIAKKMSKDDIQFQKLLQFASLAKHIKKNLNEPQQVQYTFHKNFNKDEVMKWMANPAKFVKQLRNLSRFLYDTSGHYKRLVQYFSTMLTFDYIVEPYGMTDFKPKTVDDILKKYINIVNFLEVMNLKHEFLKVCERAWIDDVAYFYEYRLKDSFFLMPLDPDYCEISGLEDGCFTFSFNFSFFDVYPKELDKYSDEFKSKYEDYKKDKKNKKWQEIDSSRSLCIKIAETIDYPVPPFSCVFEEVYSVEDYKSLKLAKTEMENYLLLVAKIPYLKESDTANNFALEINKAIEYFDRMMGSLPDQVGGLLSPFESVEAVKVDKADRNLDNVGLAEQNLYNAAGVSQLLFNSAGASGAALVKSMSIDASVAFKVLRQFERWVNKKLKDENKIIKFRATFLDITTDNRKDVVDIYKNAATTGNPVKLKYNAALGESPSATLHMEFLENSILDVVGKWKPLQSSFTQSGDNGGKPKGDTLDTTGEQTDNGDLNNPDNRT